MTNQPSVLAFYGNKRPNKPEAVAKYDVVITTYAVLAYEASDRGKTASALHPVRWHRIVLDEGHTIKNSATKQTKAVLALQGQRRWLLTGTPLSTSLGDLVGQCAFLKLGKVFAPSLPQLRSCKLTDMGWARLSDTSRSLVIAVYKYLMIRHTKTQAFNKRKELVSLPKKHTSTVRVEWASPEQQAFYKKLHANAKEHFRSFVQRGVAVTRTMEVMALLLPLRQACSGGKVTLTKEMSDIAQASAKASTAQVSAFASVSDECSICLEILEDPLQTPCRHLFCAECILSFLGAPQATHACPICRTSITKKTLKKPQGPDEGKEEEAAVDDQSMVMHSKLDALVEELEALRKDNPNAKCLVFSQFTKTLDWLKAEMTRRKMKYRTLAGKCSPFLADCDPTLKLLYWLFIHIHPR